MKTCYIKSTILAILVLLLNFGSLYAQRQSGSLDLNQFKEDREQFFIKEIGLTETEAKIFIPLSNDLLKKKYELNRKAKQELNTILNKQKLTDQDYLDIIDKNLEIKKKEAELEEVYYQKFKKILPPEKLYKYQKAELKFMRITVKKTTRSQN